MEYPNANKLIKKYLSGTSSDEENALIESWYNHAMEKPEVPADQVDYESLGQEILSHLRKSQRAAPIRKLWISSIAAAVLLILGFSLFTWIRTERKNEEVVTFEQDFLPGQSAATLKLANGKTIRLSDTSMAKIASESGISITQAKNGELVYRISESNGSASNATNTLYTSNGQHYKIVLQDGTAIWLNAGSSITYPVTFKNAAERVVQLSGEAYFEVQRRLDAPFRVLTEKDEIRVLGTHFNVRSYPDQSLRQTTLLEGQVAVSERDQPNKKHLMKPGQQLSSEGSRTILREVDVEESIAWKEGLFYFNDQNLESIMQDIAKWYDVSIVFRDESLKTILYSGTLSRYANVSQVLRKIAQMGTVKFEITGDQIIVKKTNH